MKNLGIKNHFEIKNHLVEIEILQRGLPIREAVKETANCFGGSFAEIEKAVLQGTGCDTFDTLEEVFSGNLKPGDLVLNTADAECMPEVFNQIGADGTIQVEQCYLVLRPKRN